MLSSRPANRLCVPMKGLAYPRPYWRLVEGLFRDWRRVTASLRRQRPHVRIVSGAPIFPYIATRYAPSDQAFGSASFERVSSLLPQIRSPSSRSRRVGRSDPCRFWSLTTINPRAHGGPAEPSANRSEPPAADGGTPIAGRRAASRDATLHLLLVCFCYASE